MLCPGGWVPQHFQSGDANLKVHNGSQETLALMVAKQSAAIAVVVEIW